MKALFTLMLPLLVLLVAAGPAGGEGTPDRITITAGTMHITPEGILVAEDEVLVLAEGISVRAQAMSYDPARELLHLTGPVEMKEEGGGVFTGDSLVLDLSDLTGGIRKGEILLVPGQLRVKGEEIRRLGPEEFSVSRGVVTACPGECPDWSFTASRITVREEGYLGARHAAFRIAGVPVFYMPFLYYPVKTQRQTGFLIPEFRVSEDLGLESAWPMFITLGRNADLTLAPTTFSRDSLGLATEGRYRLEYGGGGDWSGFAVGGEESGRWFVRGDHAISLAEGVWFRGRWYDAGDPEAPALFGRTFDQRHPGAVSRQAVLQGKWGGLDMTVGSSSLLADGAHSRTDAPDGRLDRERMEVHLGPAQAGPLRAGLSGEKVRFEDGMERDFLSPSAHLDLPGFEGLAGSLSGEGLLSLGGDGTEKKEAWVVTLREKVSVASEGAWGRHRIDLDLAVSAVEGAAFGSSLVRDGEDLAQDRRTGSASLRSRLYSGGMVWDLEVGGWRDTDLDFGIGYGRTEFSGRGYFLEGSVNREAQWGLVLPSLDVRDVSAKGWSVEAGYRGSVFEAALGRESTEGFPDLATGTLRFPALGAEFSGEILYDLDEGAVADEILSMGIPGRCWYLTLSRLRDRERTDWRLSFDLGL